MINSGWRTLVVDSASELSLRDFCVHIEKDKSIDIPVGQLKNVMITSAKGTVTAALLNELCRNNVNLIICDESRTPSCELVSAGHHSANAGMMQIQAGWNDEQKQYAWKRIVEQKIRSQINLLNMEQIAVPEKLSVFCSSVEMNDVTNREAQAARMYFSSLFGSGFRRHAPDSINSALNYGYTIIRSSLDRTITAYGYATALGINHRSAANRFNLSCDIMEPFRPFVDRIVYRNYDREFNWDYKKELIAVLLEECSYKGARLSVENAMEIYFREIAGFLSGRPWTAEGPCFV